MESYSTGKGSGLESSIKPGKLFINTKRMLIDKDSVKTGLIIRLHQGRFTSA